MFSKSNEMLHARGWLSIKAAVATASFLIGGTTIAFGQSADALYEAAKKEGKVVYWTANDVEPMKRVAGEFQKKYPGIQLEHFEITQGTAQERLIVEARSGIVNADIFDSSLAYMDSLLSRDLVAQYDWAAQGINPALVYYDNKCVDFYHVDKPFSYNTNLVKEGEIKSWDDMLAPKWKGKIGLEARGTGLAILMKQGWGEQKVNAFIDGLKANGVVILKGNTGTAEALAGGQVAIAMGVSSARIDRTRREMGAPVAWTPAVGPVPSEDYILCVPKNAKHPNAAQLLIRWMVSKEGRAIIWKELVFGLATGVDLSPNGEKYKNAGTEVIVEDYRESVAEQQARLKRVADRISAR